MISSPDPSPSAPIRQVVRRPAFNGAAVRISLVTLAVLVAQYGYEFTLPDYGPERDRARETTLALTVRWGGAALMSLVSLLLLVALRRDRDRVRSGDDLLVGSYWGFGLLTIVLGAATGTGVTMLVGAATAVMASLWRATGPQANVSRTFQAVTFALLVVHVLSIEVRYLFGTYLRWHHGFAPDAEVAQFREDWHSAAVQHTFVVVAAAFTLILPALLWRHRALIPAHRSSLSWMCGFLIAAAYVSLNLPAAGIGALCLLAVRVSCADEEAPATHAAGQHVPLVLSCGTHNVHADPSPLFWVPGPQAGQHVDDWAQATVALLPHAVRANLGADTVEVTRQLHAFATPDPPRADLPGVLLHWRKAHRPPVVARFGVVTRERATDLFTTDTVPDAPALRPELVASSATGAVRRVLARTYFSDREVLELRYTAEHEDGLALILIVTDTGGGILHLQDSLDSFVAGATVEPVTH